MKMPQGLYAGRVHLEEMASEMRINQGELALLKVEALIELLDKTETFDSMKARGYLVETNEDFVSAYVHYRIKKSFSETSQKLESFVEL